MTDDLFESAALAVESFFVGEAKVKRSIRMDMENLRCAVQAEKKRRAKDETTTILNPSREHA